MSRSFYINGESLVYVKGAAGTNIASLSELALSDNPITVTVIPKHKDIIVDAWGEAPPEVQFKLAEVIVNIPMIHFDATVFEECVRLAMGGATNPGQMARAGTLMGGGVTRFAAGNKYISLNIVSPQASRPWRFLSAYLTQPIGQWPLGTEKSVVQTQWRVIPYTTDPYGAGVGAQNYTLWDRNLDS